MEKREVCQSSLGGLTTRCVVDFSLLLVSSIAIVVFYVLRIKRRLARDAIDRKQSEQREQPEQSKQSVL